jgi:hypothetical protein
LHTSKTTNSSLREQAARICFGLAFLWLLIVVATTFAADILAADQKIQSDFHLNFYAAASACLHGHPELMYPAGDAVSYKDGLFDIYIHQLFPRLSSETIGTFLYWPLIGALFCPLALLPANIALLVWQCINLAGLGVYALLAARFDRINPAKFMAMTFIYLPISATLWIGQFSICGGLLPLAFGYFLMRSKRNFSAGLLWSLLILKPQYYPVALFTIIATRRWRALIGLITGTLLQIVLAVICFSPNIFFIWVHAVKLAETLFSGNITVPPNLVACVSGSLIMGLPPSFRLAAKTYVYAGAVLSSLTALAFVMRKAKKEFSSKTCLDVALIVNIIMLPLYSRLLIYDFTMFVLAAYLVFSRKWSEISSRRRQELRLMIFGAAIIVNLRVLFATFATTVSWLSTSNITQWMSAGFAIELELLGLACLCIVAGAAAERGRKLEDR